MSFQVINEIPTDVLIMMFNNIQEYNNYGEKLLYFQSNQLNKNTNVENVRLKYYNDKQVYQENG